MPFIAATAYFAMFFGLGTVFKLDGSAVYFARYADWSVTTPLLLAGLVLLAFHDRGRTGEIGGFMAAIIVLDVLMIIAGLVSSIVSNPIVKWAWYVWSCVAFLGVLYLLWGPLRAMAVAKGQAMARAYQKNLGLLTVVWFLYPIVFLVGPEGLKLVSDPATVWAILVMDVVAKVIYAFVASSTLEQALAETGPAERGYRA